MMAQVKTGLTHGQTLPGPMKAAIILLHLLIQNSITLKHLIKELKILKLMLLGLSNSGSKEQQVADMKIMVLVFF